MSRFIDAIEAELTGNKRAPVSFFSPSASISAANMSHSSGAIQDEYIMKVSWETRFYCASNLKREMLDLQFRKLRNDVYGDLHDMLYRLEQAIYEGDERAALSAIRDIKTETRG